MINNCLVLTRSVRSKRGSDDEKYSPINERNLNKIARESTETSAQQQTNQAQSQSQQQSNYQHVHQSQQSIENNFSYQQNYPYNPMSQHYPPHHPHAQSALNYSMNNKYSSNLKLPLIETNAPLQLATGPILYDY
jgi:hypothetical protein